MFKSNQIRKICRSITRPRHLTAARHADIEYQIRQMKVRQDIVQNRLETGKYSWES
jgi:hypothetical protein